MNSADAEYAAFEEKVRRTIFIDNLSPLVTEAVMKKAFDQFGNVTNVRFIMNYTEPNYVPRSALVELENADQVVRILLEIENYPFMISGMPRPVRARAAEAVMFDDRPRKPGRSIHFCWLDQQDPDFKIAKKLKLLTRVHAEEASYMLKRQIAEEEKLAAQQEENLKTNYKKYELIDGIVADGTFDRLARCYNMRPNV
ncbi:hypothetical protein NMG60_11031276 [Bertholletia excelsa]